MKRFRDLWPQVTSWENLLNAAEMAARGKRFRPDVAAFLGRREEEVTRLRHELLTETYRPGEYRRFVIREAKPRLISAAPFRDRVVHHALCRVLEPIWERRFIFDSYACRSDKGMHAAADRYQEFSRRAPYVLQCDVARYFPSVDHTILWEQLRDVVADREVLRLAALILATSGDEGSLWPSGRGIPLGNQTSQFFANVYLDSFDHWMKETLKRRFYLRYVDDFIVLGDSARELAEVRDAASERLATLGLKLHARKRRIFPVREGCDFVGYRIFPHHRLLRRHSGFRFRRRLKGMMKAFRRGDVSALEIRSRVGSWIGHARHADTWGLRRAVLSQATEGSGD
ncbi:MAG: group II intron reverse transcriptase domain-containing protein [Planctomycetes bacterium]|nr:group II intron reverse transcriptase domain-containing protein [Planctomycetota bacterium]